MKILTKVCMGSVPVPTQQSRYTLMWRQLGRRLSLLLVLGLSACGGSAFEEGQVGFIEGFFGGIIVDEPRAALIGRDVLSAGGSASDAAVAAYFTMAVTMPGQYRQSSMIGIMVIAAPSPRGPRPPSEGCLFLSSRGAPLAPDFSRAMSFSKRERAISSMPNVAKSFRKMS